MQAHAIPLPHATPRSLLRSSMPGSKEPRHHREQRPASCVPPAFTFVQNAHTKAAWTDLVGIARAEWRGSRQLHVDKTLEERRQQRQVGELARREAERGVQRYAAPRVDGTPAARKGTRLKRRCWRQRRRASRRCGVVRSPEGIGDGKRRERRNSTSNLNEGRAQKAEGHHARDERRAEGMVVQEQPVRIQQMPNPRRVGKVRVARTRHPGAGARRPTVQAAR